MTRIYGIPSPLLPLAILFVFLAFLGWQAYVAGQTPVQTIMVDGRIYLPSTTCDKDYSRGVQAASVDEYTVGEINELNSADSTWSIITIDARTYLLYCKHLGPDSKGKIYFLLENVAASIVVQAPNCKDASQRRAYLGDQGNHVSASDVDLGSQSRRVTSVTLIQLNGTCQKGVNL